MNIYILPEHINMNMSKVHNIFMYIKRTGMNMNKRIVTADPPIL